MTCPSLLVSYINVNTFLANRSLCAYRTWVLDSGAYSQLTSGKIINLERYIADCLALMTGSFPPEIIFSLDVIGDPEASLRNHERMRAAGVDAVPTFHYGSPWHYLPSVAASSSKVALGGLVARGRGGHGTKISVAQRMEFLGRCFSVVWPKWVHGFGCTHARLLAAYPFASVDSTTWIMSPSKYGFSSVLGSRKTPKRAANPVVFDQALTNELQYWSKLERDTGEKFGRFMDAAGLPRLSIRLAINSASDLRVINRDRVARCY